MIRNLTLSLAGLPDVKIARAFKIVRNLDPNITLPEIRRCADDFSPVGNIQLASASIEDYVSNLITAREVAHELLKNGIQSKMLDSESAAEIQLADLDSLIDINRPFLAAEFSPSVSQFLDAINASDWFGSLGDPVAESVNVVHEYAPNKTLSYICVGIQNSIINAVINKFDCHHGFPTPLFTKLNEKLDRIMQEKLDKTPPATPKFDPDDVRGLILHACLEMQYPDTDSSFATECCQWIARGKLPIGWDGVFPDGKLVLT